MPSGPLMFLPVYLLSPHHSLQPQPTSFHVSLSLKKKKNYLFLAVLGLCCCARTFSSCFERRLLSSCGVQAFHCGGFSCRRTWALGCLGFSSCCAQAQQLWCMGLVAPQHVRSSRISDQTRILLHWQVDSSPLNHQGSPISAFLAKSSLLNLLVSRKLFPSPASAASCSSDFN